MSDSRPLMTPEIGQDLRSRFLAIIGQVTSASIDRTPESEKDAIVNALTDMGRYIKESILVNGKYATVDDIIKAVSIDNFWNNSNLDSKNSSVRASKTSKVVDIGNLAVSEHIDSNPQNADYVNLALQVFQVIHPVFKQDKTYPLFEILANSTLLNSERLLNENNSEGTQGMRSIEYIDLGLDGYVSDENSASLYDLVAVLYDRSRNTKDSDWEKVAAIIDSAGEDFIVRSKENTKISYDPSLIAMFLANVVSLYQNDLPLILAGNNIEGPDKVKIAIWILETYFHVFVTQMQVVHTKNKEKDEKESIAVLLDMIVSPIGQKCAPTLSELENDYSSDVDLAKGISDLAFKKLSFLVSPATSIEDQQFRSEFISSFSSAKFLVQKNEAVINILGDKQLQDADDSYIASQFDRIDYIEALKTNANIEQIITAKVENLPKDMIPFCRENFLSQFKPLQEFSDNFIKLLPDSENQADFMEYYPPCHTSSLDEFQEIAELTQTFMNDPLGLSDSKLIITHFIQNTEKLSESGISHEVIQHFHSNALNIFLSQLKEKLNHYQVLVLQTAHSFLAESNVAVSIQKFLVENGTQLAKDVKAILPDIFNARLILNPSDQYISQKIVLDYIETHTQEELAVKVQELKVSPSLQAASSDQLKVLSANLTQRFMYPDDVAEVVWDEKKIAEEAFTLLTDPSSIKTEAEVTSYIASDAVVTRAKEDRYYNDRLFYAFKSRRINAGYESDNNSEASRVGTTDNFSAEFYVSPLCREKINQVKKEGSENYLVSVIDVYQEALKTFAEQSNRLSTDPYFSCDTVDRMIDLMKLQQSFISALQEDFPGTNDIKGFLHGAVSSCIEEKCRLAQLTFLFGHELCPLSPELTSEDLEEGKIYLGYQENAVIIKRKQGGEAKEAIINDAEAAKAIKIAIEQDGDFSNLDPGAVENVLALIDVNKRTSIEGFELRNFLESTIIAQVEKPAFQQKITNRFFRKLDQVDDVELNANDVDLVLQMEQKRSEKMTMNQITELASKLMKNTFRDSSFFQDFTWPPSQVVVQEAKRKIDNASFSRRFFQNPRWTFNQKAQQRDDVYRALSELYVPENSSVTWQKYSENRATAAENIIAITLGLDRLTLIGGKKETLDQFLDRAKCLKGRLFEHGVSADLQPKLSAAQQLIANKDNSPEAFSEKLLGERIIHMYQFNYQVSRDDMDALFGKFSVSSDQDQAFMNNGIFDYAKYQQRCNEISSSIMEQCNGQNLSNEKKFKINTVIFHSLLDVQQQEVPAYARYMADRLAAEYSEHRQNPTFPRDGQKQRCLAALQQFVMKDFEEQEKILPVIHQAIQFCVDNEDWGLFQDALLGAIKKLKIPLSGEALNKLHADLAKEPFASPAKALLVSYYAKDKEKLLLGLRNFAAHRHCADLVKELVDEFSQSQCAFTSAENSALQEQSSDVDEEKNNSSQPRASDSALSSFLDAVPEHRSGFLPSLFEKPPAQAEGVQAMQHLKAITDSGLQFEAAKAIAEGRLVSKAAARYRDNQTDALYQSLAGANDFADASAKLSQPSPQASA